VQLKYDHPDAMATPSERGLVMEAFSAILERQLQFTIRTLDQAVWTPSGILVIPFYSNIGLGRNQRRWKANKKYCELMVQTAINIVRSRPDGNIKRPDGPTEFSKFAFRTLKQ
jgi:hypothetical protein